MHKDRLPATARTSIPRQGGMERYISLSIGKRGIHDGALSEGKVYSL